MERAVADNDRMGRFVSSDSTGGYPVRFNDFWGRWTEIGVHGDPTKATAEKGRLCFEASVTGLVELVNELRAWPIAERRDMHRGAVQKEVRW
jgi:creatinine amidohydrolase/Fe(II)-dependent formamide hydrolase-like protein